MQSGRSKSNAIFLLTARLVAVINDGKIIQLFGNQSYRQTKSLRICFVIQSVRGEEALLHNLNT